MLIIISSFSLLLLSSRPRFRLRYPHCLRPPFSLHHKLSFFFLPHKFISFPLPPSPHFPFSSSSLPASSPFLFFLNHLFFFLHLSFLSPIHLFFLLLISALSNFHSFLPMYALILPMINFLLFLLFFFLLFPARAKYRRPIISRPEAMTQNNTEYDTANAVDGQLCLVALRLGSNFCFYTCK